jgi:hypothetical protein
VPARKFTVKKLTGWRLNGKSVSKDTPGAVPFESKYFYLFGRDASGRQIRKNSKTCVDEATAMKITGHRTNSMFKRYSVVDAGELRDALVKVGKFVAAR